MAQSENEIQYVAEVAKLSSVSPSIVASVIATQVTMLLRDIGINDKAYTFLGTVELRNDKLVLISPAISHYLDPRFLKEKLFAEVAGDE